ncbi:MAG: tetratricopeptide repeat protein [Oscillospiraceae bacterium]
MITEKKKLYTKPWVRVMAGILAFVLVLTLMGIEWTWVDISADTDDAAQEYLAGETEYVNADELERLRQQILNLRQPILLEDYYGRAGTAIAAEDYDEALEYIDKCLELFTPEYGEELHTDLLVKRGCLLTMLNRGTEAVEPLEAALEIDPEQGEVYLVLAQIYSGTGQTGELTQALSRYVELEPGDGDMRLLLAQLQYEAENYTASSENVLRLLEDGGEESRELSELCAGLGLILTQTGDYARALKLLDAAVSMAAGTREEAGSGTRRALPTRAPRIQPGNWACSTIIAVCATSQWKTMRRRRRTIPEP